MFFDSINEIAAIAQKNSTSVFVIPDNLEVNIKNALILKPEQKAVITIEQVRETLKHLNTRQTTDRFVIIRPAEKMEISTMNTLLKSLEEPGEKTHFVLITSHPSSLLPTILSRASVYILRQDFKVEEISSTDEAKKTLAKRLITARPSELVSLAQEIGGKKEKVRDFTLDILAIAIEMLYKSYFLTNKEIFLQKLPKLLLAYENIAANGNIKLHLVADLC